MDPAGVTALILAGGKATRLGGVDKRELVVDGRTIFVRQVDVLRDRVAEILVSSPREVAGYRTVRDAIAGGGPLAGIAAGLAGARTPWLLVVAGDMPHLSPAVIDRLLARATPEVDAVGVRLGGRPEPLVCVLAVAACLPRVQARLAGGDLKASRLLEDGALRVAWLEVAADGPDARAFFNINVPEDL